jgi:Brp/Blh family beta-carotene 15,15'-monooxygenase
MTLTRIQGLAFCALAVLGVVATRFLPALERSTEVLLVGCAIVVLGVPHGALDTIFARELYGVRTWAAWLRFGVVYLVLAAAVVGLWFGFPMLFLIGFLMISIAHFSGDPEGQVPWPVRLAHGGAIIFLPLLDHREEVENLFGLLVGDGAAGWLTPWLAYAAGPWAIGLGAAALFLAWRRSWGAVELGCLGLLAWLAPPLISFAIFFCTMHSARHMIRSARFSRQSSVRLLLAAMFVPLILVAVASVVAWYLLRDQSVDRRVVQIVFVGLAALTVPHMALVERVRLRGWVSGADGDGPPGTPT